MSNVGRELTIRVKITDDAKSTWIWNQHLNPDATLGIDVRAIANGNLFAENEMLDEQLAFMLNRFSMSRSAQNLQDDVEDGIVPDTPMIRDLIKKIKANA